MACSSFSCFSFLFFFIFFVSTTSVQAQVKSSIPAIYVFGDSTVDPGNNNYIKTAAKADFPPYGKDFPNQVPTGRFTDGKLTTDFIASYLGIKEFVPPYLDKTLSQEELTTGVSFASAGSGYDLLTAQTTSAISLEQQLQSFKEYKAAMEQVMGKTQLDEHISKSAFVISAGTVDFVVTYFNLPLRRKQYSVAEYENLLLQNTHVILQALLDLGARKFGVVGIPPIGCLPVVVTLKPGDPSLKGGCLDDYNKVADEYNQKLQPELQAIQDQNSAIGAIIEYADIYGALLDIIQNTNKYGLEEARRGCCGSGRLETGPLCNPKSLICPDASKFVFFDSIHPTQKTYNLLFTAFRDIIDRLAKN